jgi:hypothetical protein
VNTGLRQAPFVEARDFFALMEYKPALAETDGCLAVERRRPSKADGPA